MAEEKSINLLWNCAKELSTHTHTERLLKSYYTNTCRKLARHNVQLPEDCVGTARMCGRCGNQWTDGNYQLQLKPQRLANNAKRRRLIARLDMDKAKRQRGTLSTGARKRAKWLKKRMASNIAVDCSLCGHSTMLPLEKPKKRSETIATTSRTETITTTTLPVASKQKKKKNNKNKDINAGLKPTTQKQQQQQHQQKPPTAQKAAATTTTTTAVRQSSKQKKKSKAAQSTPAASNAPKMQSKTQKQNVLLQLAAQLKSHASKNASKTPQSRLQALLK
ncbi:uncharacterized protein LOC117785288 [Drosophila innubila]|uniref:uncharacterized protein LOC117785288 n=1 Tax=Drosophila innubila TaxID=198719 RepID=UPI00148D3EEE|nr:uncharacterized protein LOC117785288 [Drosophila innubila]